MKINLSLKPIASVKLLILALLVLGIFFRLANLDKKIFWHDEVYTALWVGGHTPQEVVAGLYGGQLLSIEDLQKYQRLKPESTVIDTISLLAQYDTQHPPLYYSIVRLWVEVFGDSVTAIRGISALLSLLTLPFAYWLGWELFANEVSALMLLGLVAISPLNILYAQEAREYGLWTALMFFSGAIFLRAIRKPTKINWGLYALSLTLGLYTFLFTIFSMGAHALYVCITQRLRWNRISTSYLLSTFISCVLFVPWGIQLARSEAPSAVGWTSVPMPMTGLVRSWIANATRIFFDINLDASDPFIFTLPSLLIILILIVCALIFLYRKSPTQIWLYITLVGGFTALVLIIPDVVMGGRRSTVNRYLILLWISIQMAFAYWLSWMQTQKYVYQKTLSGISRNLPTGIILTVFLLGIVSNIAIMQSDTWWTKKNSHHHPAAARIINQFQHPLLMSSDFNANQGEILSLSHVLDADVQVLLVEEPAVPPIPDGFKDMFLFNPSPNLVEGLESADYSLDLVYEAGRLWRVTP